jgi:hypothetical protein
LLCALIYQQLESLKQQKSSSRPLWLLVHAAATNRTTVIALITAGHADDYRSAGHVSEQTNA